MTNQTEQTKEKMAVGAFLSAMHDQGLDGAKMREAMLDVLGLAALQEQASSQPASIKTWQQRLEEACPALGPLHIHACVEEINDAMQAEIDDLRSALQEQAPDAPWLTKAHMLCTDHGIPQGHIEHRIDLLRVMFAAPVQAREQDKADAERYRWLREGNDAKHGAAWYVAVNLYGCEWDAAIDAAMPLQHHSQRSHPNLRSQSNPSNTSIWSRSQSKGSGPHKRRSY